MLKNLFLVCKRTVAGRKEENKLEYGFEVLNNGMAINTKNTHYISSHYLRNNYTDGMCHVQARSFSHITSNDQEAMHCFKLTQPLGRTISYHLEKKKRNPQHARWQMLCTSCGCFVSDCQSQSIFSSIFPSAWQRTCNKDATHSQWKPTISTTIVSAIMRWWVYIYIYNNIYIYIYIDLSIPIRSSTQCEFVITRSTITVKYYIHLPYKPQ